MYRDNWGTVIIKADDDTFERHNEADRENAPEAGAAGNNVVRHTLYTERTFLACSFHTRIWQ